MRERKKAKIERNLLTELKKNHLLKECYNIELEEKPLEHKNIEKNGKKFKKKLFIERLLQYRIRGKPIGIV